jgi:hypothetical protein
MPNALAHAHRDGRPAVSALIAIAFAQDDAETAKASGAVSSIGCAQTAAAGLLDEAETTYSPT